MWSSPKRQTQGHTAAMEGCPRVPPRAPFWPPTPPYVFTLLGSRPLPPVCAVSHPGAEAEKSSSYQSSRQTSLYGWKVPSSASS